MFSLSHKKTIFRFSIIGIIIAATFSFAGLLIMQKINHDVEATSPGGSVYMTDDSWIEYDWDDSWGSTRGLTNRFHISSDGRSYLGYCTDASKLNPEVGTYTAIHWTWGDNNGKIKLMMYLFENMDSIPSDVRNTVFNWSGDSDSYYAWTHAFISAHDSDGADYGVNGMSQAGIDWINSTSSYLGSLINSNHKVWLIAKTYNMFYLEGGDSAQDVTWIEGPNFIHGNIKVQKCDKETGSCTSTTGRSLAGIEFKVYNSSGTRIYNDLTDQVYENNAEVATGTTNNSGQVSFNNLPAGTYTVKETATNSLYALSSVGQTVTISTNGENKNLTFQNSVKRGNVKFTKKDSTSGNAMANVAFRISALDSNNNTTESHIVVSNGSGVVDTSANQHSNHTNGYDSIFQPGRAIAYQGYGTWFGLDQNGHSVTVDNTVGALPIGKYQIQELDCRSNLFCYDVPNQKKTFNVTTDGQMVNLGDWNNNCAEVSIGTTATDNSDGDHFVEVGSSVTIKDHISYCAKENMQYTIKGVLMNKKTNQPIVVNGQTLEKTITVTPTSTCGNTDVLFTFNSSTLGGVDIVVFEYLYYNGEVIASHTDLNDSNQTVTVISLGTTATDNADGDKFIEAGETVKLKDTINYCVRVNTAFTIKGTLMDKSTGEPIMIDGQKVEQTININPTKACDQANMIFEFDASELGGTEVVVYEDLYYGNKKILSHNDIDDEGQTITVINFGTTATDNADGNKYIEEGEKVELKDTIAYCVRANHEFEIKGILIDKKTGEPLLVDEEPIEETITINPEEACGETEMLFTFDASELAWSEIVVFEDLYYEGELILSHEDLEDEDQTVEIIYLQTYAVNKTTSEKLLPYGEDVEIKDTVDYCLKADQEYTIKGVVMDKVTRNGILSNSMPVESEIEFTPEECCGEIDMFYELNTKDLGGKELVIFESLYSGDELILEHRDFRNVGESLSVELPPPDTGLFTKNTKETTTSNNNTLFIIGVVVVSISGYVISRLIARKRFLVR